MSVIVRTSAAEAKRSIVALVLIVSAFVIGHDFALISLGEDMRAGRLILLDKGLLMQIHNRRIFK